MPRLRRGLTLIEVLAAIAILGTVLVGVVLARSRHTRQLADTHRQNALVRATDELIASWWSSAEGVPVEQSGVCGPNGEMVWQTRVVSNRAVETMGARVVRVEVRPEQPGALPQGPPEQAEVIVDLVLPDPARRKARQAQSQPNAPAPDATDRKGGPGEWRLLPPAPRAPAGGAP